MIRVHGLTKYYGELAAIKNVTFNVAKGEVLGFLGPNAAGKTTTMRILAGYIPASSGEATVAGYDVHTHSLDARRHIGYLPASVPLYQEMKVRAYLSFMAGLHGILQHRRRVDEVMQLTQTTQVADSTIGKLSRGRRRRVGLAQALLHNPEVLILDEPTVGLDPGQIVEVRDVIRELGKEHAIILSTHIISEVEQVCERVLIISDGQIVSEESRGQLRARLKGTERIRMQVAGASPAQVVPALRAIAEVRSVEPVAGNAYDITCSPGADLRACLAEIVERNGWELLELRPEGLGLEGIFLRLAHDDVVN